MESGLENLCVRDVRGLVDECLSTSVSDTGTDTDSETQRHRDTETQRHRDTEGQRDRDSARQRDRETERQRDRASTYLPMDRGSVFAHEPSLYKLIPVD